MDRTVYTVGALLILFALLLITVAAAHIAAIA